MTVFVKTLSGVVYDMSISPSDTIKQLKVSLRKRDRALPPSLLNRPIIFMDKVIGDGVQLIDAHLLHESTVFLNDMYLEDDSAEPVTIHTTKSILADYLTSTPAHDLQFADRLMQCSSYLECSDAFVRELLILLKRNCRKGQTMLHVDEHMWPCDNGGPALQCVVQDAIQKIRAAGFEVRFYCDGVEKAHYVDSFFVESFSSHVGGPALIKFVVFVP